MKKNMSIALASLLAFVATIANAQTTPVSGASDFRNDVAAGMQSIQSDPEARAVAQEVNGEDAEEAGDAHGSSVAVDGEKSDSEIDTEIEDEVESESISSDGSGDQSMTEDAGTATTTVDMTTSGDSGE